MTESSNLTKIPTSPKVTLKEEPDTQDRPNSPNPFLPADQVEFTFDEITFTTNNKVALLYPSHPKSEYFQYTTKTLEDSKIWVSTSTGGIRGEICITTFRNALRAHYLPHSSKYITPPSLAIRRPWFATFGRKTGRHDQISNKDAIILYCLANKVKVDFPRLIWEDIIHKLNKKTREKVVPSPRSLLPEWDLLLITTNNLRIDSSGVKPPLGWLPVWESAKRSPTPSRWAFDETRAKVRWSNPRSPSLSSEDYDEEREMEPRPEPRMEATPTLWLRSPGIRRQRERVVGFKDAPNREENRRGRNVEGIRSLEIEAREGHHPLTNMGGNLPPNGTLLSHHARPFIPSSLHIPTRFIPIHANPYSQPSAGLVHGQALNFPFQTQIGNPPAGGTFTYHPQGGYIPQAFTNNSAPSYNGPMHPIVTPSSSFYTQPMYAPPNIPAYPNLVGPFADSTGSVTPFVRWIEDYPLPDGLKMPSHIGSYDGKGDQLISYTFSKGISACRNG
ncbi:hypothetical protein Tco_1377718 [Tanacetum coccineum]